MGSEGTVLSEFSDLRKAGAVGFSDDGRPVAEQPDLMRIALEYAWSFGLPVISHCEDLQPQQGRPHARGAGLHGTGAAGHSVHSRDDHDFAGHRALPNTPGTAVHICHVSSAGSVETDQKGESQGREGNRGNSAALPVPDRREPARFRHEQESQPSHRGQCGFPGIAGGPEGRHDRRHSQRPRPAVLRGKGRGIRIRHERHHRHGDISRALPEAG